MTRQEVIMKAVEGRITWKQAGAPARDAPAELIGKEGPRELIDREADTPRRSVLDPR